MFCAGGALGWLAHDAVRPVPTLEDMLLADMTDAYAFYGARDYPVDFPPDRAADFVTWIGRSFEREVRPPDLADFGYAYRGGRLIPTGGAKIGLFQFERPEGAGLAVFFWTTPAQPQVERALNDADGIAAHFWATNGLSFAVISERANSDLETAAKAIFSFYEQAFAPG